MSNKIIYTLGCLVFTIVGCGGSQNAGTSAASMAHFVGHIFGPGNLDGAVSEAAFSGPRGIAADSSGNLYLTEESNHSIRKISALGVVSTLAGGSGVSGSANGTGAAAQFNKPHGIAVDSSGVLFVADKDNHTIRKITSAGEVTTFAGSAGAAGSTDDVGGAARFNAPVALAFDSLGNLFVAEQANHIIRKILPDGTVSTYAGNAANGAGLPVPGPKANARFSNPYGLAIDSQNNIFVADYFNHVIQKIAADGTVSTFAGSANTADSINGVGGAARFNQPNSIAVDANDNLYVSDDDGRIVRKITPGAAVTTLAGTSNLTGSDDGTGSDARFLYSWGLVVSDNVLVAADASNNNIRKITLAGVVSTFSGSATVSGSTDAVVGTAARFSTPYGSAYDANGNAYITDNSNHTVRKVTAAGVVSTIAGSAGNSGTADSTGGSGLTARFNSPTGIAVDTAGNIYVSDYGNQTIRKISADYTQVTTVAGAAGVGGDTDGPAANARFAGPDGLAVDADGNLYVADSGNSTIRKITASTGVVSTLAGSSGTTGTQDGTGPAASFHLPTGVAVDASGHVYVTDLVNHTIRKVTSAGVVTTLAGTAGSSGTTNGTGAAARFKEPYGIAIDSAGNLYVADGGNSLVRK
jgi:sugar lactone lactonase YvrE